MAEVDSLAPVASIVDLLLGIVALLLVSKAGNKATGDKIAGYLIGWILVFKGFHYLLVSVLEFQAGSATVFGNIDMSELREGFLTYALRMFQITSLVLICFLPLVFPFRVLPKAWDEKVILASITLLCLVLCVVHLITDFDYLFVENVLMVPGYLVLISIYLRFLMSELQTGQQVYRKASVASGLILMAIYGEPMTYWLSQVVAINDDFSQRLAIEFGYIPSGLSWFGVMTGLTVGAISICTLCAGEAVRSFKLGMTPFSVIVFLIFVVGLIAGIADLAVLDIVRSCYEAVCQPFPSAYNIWYDFTSESLVYLYTPILFMYVLLNYDIIDTQSGENRWMIRIIVILLLLIVSSTVLELIQSFLPIPEMISSAALAIIVAIFIGWEEKIVTWLITGSESVSANVPIAQLQGEEVSSRVEAKVFHLSLGGILIFIVVVSLLLGGLS